MTGKGGLRVYGEREAAARLAAELPRWEIAEGHLRRCYRVQGWKSVLLLAGAIGHLAEQAWHHPELRLSWGRVEVRLRTHERHGITERDFALARRIEELVTWRPGPDGALEGTPDDPRFAYLREDSPRD